MRPSPATASPPTPTSAPHPPAGARFRAKNGRLAGVAYRFCDRSEGVWIASAVSTGPYNINQALRSRPPAFGRDPGPFTMAYVAEVLRSVAGC